ncbi:HETS [Fusarium pseudograminearum CS3096]|uniref:HETS n=1 Tax=Fusarium pseudograminearum (strain CS3096) TaxID=1028729 RepID=K3UPW5_FUSPC|nr:HETS [Fusarium pseudograminearum CS3096]EKJ74396.1 HETS [Fusarium pseudograminearum CS3096]
MAEVFGAVAGAISIAALFNNCIDCFDYIQIARHFGDDFSKYQLRLDVAKCRLSRWGAAVNVNDDPRFCNNASKDQTTTLAETLLGEIVARFESAQKSSLLYKTVSRDPELEICSEADLGAVPQRLHTHFRTLTMQRQNRVGLTKKAYWAIYDKNKMGRLIDDIFDFINDLEKVFPATPQATSRLVEMDIEEVNDQQGLKMIQGAAKDLDPILADTTESKLQEITGQNTAGYISGKGRTNIGHTFVNDSFVQSKGFCDNTFNHVDEINLDETARVNIGNTYGGKGFWD